MKYLLLVLFLIGCGGQSKVVTTPIEVDEQPQYDFVQVELTDLYLQNITPDGYGGTITQTGDEDWFFQTHTNPDCVDKSKGKCRKSAVMFTEGLPVDGRVTHYKYDGISILKYNMDDSPDHLIVWEIWAKLFDEQGGNHPPQTIKLLNDNGQLKYCGFDNAWQFALTDISQLKHVPDGSNHPHEDRNNGCANTELNTTDKIDLYVWDYGRTALYINDKLIFDKEYQVKGEGRSHLLFWGPYWSLGYNKEIDPSKSIELTINGFSRSVYNP